MDRGQDIDELEDRARQAERDLGELLESDQGDIEGAQRRAQAAAKVWHLRTLILIAQGETEDAARAHAQATKAEELAIRAAKAGVVTRIEALEQLVKQARDRGAGVRGLAKQATRTKPPGHDPRP